MAGLSDLEDEDIQLFTKDSKQSIKPEIGERFPEEEDYAEPVALPKCSWCGSISNLVRKFLACDHFTCYECTKLHPTFYSTIPQSKVADEYGLSADELRSAVRKNALIVEEKRNPHGYDQNMKLYYCFQIAEICSAKYGSVEAYQARRQERKAKRHGAQCTAQRSKVRRRRGRADEPSAPPKMLCQHPNWSPEETEGDTHNKSCLTCGHTEVWTEI